MQLYLREGFSLPAQASFFLICVGDRAGLGYWSHFMSRPECIQVGVDVYIRHHKYQVKPHSSSWFSAACAATIVYRSHFFICINRINLLNLKQSSDRLVIIAKRVLKLSNLHMLIKQKNPSFHRDLALGTLSKFQ